MRSSALLALVLLGAVSQSIADFEAVQTDLFSAGGTLTNAWADFDGDNDLDLFVGFNGAGNRLYRNNDGDFTDIAATVGLADARATRAAAWGDFDNDGDADLLVGFAPGDASVLVLYRNDGSRFVDVTGAVGLATDGGAVRQTSWIDIDGDGDVDLFVAFRDRANALFRNDNGLFTDIADALGLADSRRTVGAVFFDYDLDGDIDLYTANMDGDANGLFRNDGERFNDIADSVGLAWGGRRAADASNGTVRPCAADVDNDGRLDLFTANYGPNGLFLNRGNQFEDASRAWGIAIDGRYDACAFDDFDHDGRIDLYVNGTVTGGVSYRDYLFRNVGSRFEDVTPPNIESLQADHGVQWSDFDGDGDVDLALTGARPDGMHSLLRNRLPADIARRSLRVLILDGDGNATRAGTHVQLLDAAARPMATRLVDSGSGYNSQSIQPVHFGLAQLDTLSVVVTVPGPTGVLRATLAAIDPRDYVGGVLAVRIDRSGALETERR